MVYIAHPLTSFGNPGLNYQRVTKICQEIVVKYPHIVPISPIHAFKFFPWEGSQERVMECCIKLLLSCEELWLFGQWESSSGCREEIKAAHKACMPILVKEASQSSLQ